MKQLVLLVIFVAIGTTLSGCVSTGPMQSVVSAGEAEKITEEITELARQWGRVPITKDMDHLKRILADDFSLVTPDGNVIDKEDWIALIEKDIKEKTNRSLALNIQSPTCAFMGKTLLLRMVLPMP